MRTVTKRQHEVLEYIKQYLKTHQYAPSFREIMQHFSFTSPGTVYRYIHVLKNKGLLDTKKQKSRSLVPLQNSEASHQQLALPFIGHISAGKPIETFSKSLVFEVPHSLVQKSDSTYVLRVNASTLLDELIAEGDYLLIEARQTAESGETIVAFLNEQEVIIKKYFLEEGYVQLISQNPQKPPMIVREEDLMIQGVIVGVIRNLKK